MKVKDDIQSKVRSVGSMIHGVAKNLARDVYGPKEFAPQTSFADLEELGVQLGNALTREFIQHAAAQQAQELEQRTSCCPTCQGETELRPPAPKVLITQRGTVAWSEPERFCSTCRRAFFPSVP